MNRRNVTSSNIKSIGYDEDTKVLEVEFLSSGVYQYSNVPPHTHKELMASDSVGKYFFKEIKNNFTANKL